MPCASEFTKFGNTVLYIYLYASVKSMTLGNVYDYLPMRPTFALLAVAACEFTLIWKCILNSVTILESVKLWSSISKSMNSESSCEYVNFKDQKLPKSKSKAAVDAGIEKIQEVHHHKGESDIQSDYDLRDGSSLAHLMESSHNPNQSEKKTRKSKSKASVDAGIEKIQEVHHHHKGESDIQSDYDLRDGSSLAHLMESSHTHTDGNPKKQKSSDNETEILDQLTVNPRKKLKFKK